MISSGASHMKIYLKENFRSLFMDRLSRNRALRDSWRCSVNRKHRSDSVEEGAGGPG